MDVANLVNEGLRTLHPYVPGKPICELKRELHLTTISKIASNENPMGASAKIQEHWQALNQDLARYPDGGGYSLKLQLASLHKVQPEQITLGNGSEEVITMLFRAFVNQTDTVIIPQYSFALYRLLAQAIAAAVCWVEAKNYATDLPAILNAITDKTKLICIANPNNPTGTRIDKDQLLAFLAKVPSDVLVLLDEAYAEYNRDANYLSGLACLNQYPNLIVTRTFSKAYGLASIRCGYGISSVAIADYLNRIRPPFNVSTLALSMCQLAAQDQDFITQSMTFNEFQKQQFYQACEKRNIPYIESYGNFVTIELALEATQIFKNLLQQGVITRPLTGYELPKHVRISLGTKEEMQHFWQALDSVKA